ncbi:MAG: helix-turn-helix domain-containing protein [Candidatus Competibacter sp.]|nr:helix-turn-helix domain-containing protein [Candidatus Competibacter sp.]
MLSPRPISQLFTLVFDAVFVSRPAVTQWETGETKTLEGENLVRVAGALGVTTEWLLYGTGLGPGESRPIRTMKVSAGDDVVEVSEEVLQLVLSLGRVHKIASGA